MKITEKTKLIALAHLKNGKTPRETSELLGISYSQALKLNKDLAKAEKNNTLQELFNLDEAAVEALLENVHTELAPAVEVLEGEIQPLKDKLNELSDEVSGARALEQELVESARRIAKQINANAISAPCIESILVMTEALTKLQTAFFAKQANVQVNNINSNFEKFLKD
jgi:FtsZ-binding cell division protein ZapB